MPALIVGCIREKIPRYGSQLRCPSTGARYAMKKPRRSGALEVRRSDGYLAGPRWVIRPAAIMKLSKRFSETWNHDTWSARNAFHGS